MGFWTFFLAAFLSLPKQFVTVYLGVSLEQGANGKLNYLPRYPDMR